MLWQVHVFQIENLWKYEFLELQNMSYFPPELTTVLHIRFWFSNLESILQKCSRQNYSYFPRQPGWRNNIIKLRPETKTKLKPKTAKQYEISETCKTTEMTKTKRLKRNEPNDQNETTKIVYKKNWKNKMNAQGCQASVVIFISFRLWSTPNLSHGEIQLSLY